MCRHSRRQHNARLASSGAEAPTLPAPRYRPFFITALIVMLSSGAAWGCWFLWQIAVSGKVTGVSLHAINAHAQTVIYGFLGLFIMGFAYQAFPRLWKHSLFAPALAKPVLAMTVTGMILLAMAELHSGNPLAMGMVTVGGVLQFMGVGTFVVQLVKTFQLGRTPLLATTATILVAAGFFLLSTVLSTWHTYNLITTQTKYEAIYFTSVYQPSLRYIQLHGMTLLMILGVASRLLPSFFTIARPSERKMWIVLIAITVAVLGESAIFITFRLTENPKIAAFLLIPWLVLLISCASLVWSWKLWRPLQDESGRIERMGKFVRIAFAWLIVSLVMTIAQPLWSHMVGTYFSHAWYGASRQAFTVGFATMMIIGFTARVVPNLNGVFPNTLPSLRGVFILLNVGLTLHLLGQVCTDLTPLAARVLPIAGIMQWIAFAVWSAHLLWCIRQGRRSVPAPDAAKSGVSLTVLSST